jgi:hypothetical protein
MLQEKKCYIQDIIFVISLESKILEVRRYFLSKVSLQLTEFPAPLFEAFSNPGASAARGRAIAQAVSHWLPTAAARIRIQV